MNPLDELAYDTLGRLNGLIEMLEWKELTTYYKAALLKRMIEVRKEYFAKLDAFSVTPNALSQLMPGPERMEASTGKTEASVSEEQL